MARSVFVAPNLYELSGRHLPVSYSTSGIDGKAHFTYQDHQQTKSSSGDEIRRLDTDVGTLVSVTLLRTIDSGGTTFSVLIPRVNIPGEQTVPIRTDGITTLHKFSILPMSGQQDLYSVTRLGGSASRVFF